MFWPKPSNFDTLVCNSQKINIVANFAKVLNSKAVIHKLKEKNTKEKKKDLNVPFLNCLIYPGTILYKTSY